MEGLDSLVIRSARAAAVPAGDALAMDRGVFANLVTEAIAARAEIELVREEVAEIPAEGFVVLATGPLTSPALDRAIGALLGTKDLYFYDSMAPIVEASSLDFSKMYALSRYGKGKGEDYWNCPLSRDEYERFLDALLVGETVPVKDFEKGIYFEGCLADRGHGRTRARDTAARADEADGASGSAHGPQSVGGRAAARRTTSRGSTTTSSDFRRS